MHNLIREKSVTGVFDNYEAGISNAQPAPSSYSTTNKYKIYRMAHRYKDQEKLSSSYTLQQPLSVVIFMYPMQPNNKCHYGACYISQSKAWLAPTVRDPGTEIVIGSKLLYWKWELYLEGERQQPLEEIHIVDYGLLLPMVCDPQRVGQVLLPNYYTKITYEWNSEKTLRV
jgi:hypothetical protein